MPARADRCRLGALVLRLALTSATASLRARASRSLAPAFPLFPGASTSISPLRRPGLYATRDRLLFRVDDVAEAGEGEGEVEPERERERDERPEDPGDSFSAAASTRVELELRLRLDGRAAGATSDATSDAASLSSPNGTRLPLPAWMDWGRWNVGELRIPTLVSLSLSLSLSGCACIRACSRARPCVRVR